MNIASDVSPIARRWLVPLLVALATLLACFCRITPSLNAPLWEDEVTTARFSNDAPSLFSIVRNWISSGSGVDPPLYYLLSRLVAPSYLEPSDFRFRLVSLLCSILAVPLIFIASRRIVGSPAAALAAVGLAVNGYSVAMAQQHRSYSLMILGSVIFYHAVYMLATRLTLARALYVCASAAVLLYTHLFGIFPVATAVLVMGGVAVFCTIPGESRRRQWLYLLGVAAALLLLVSPLLLQSLMLIKSESGLGKGSEHLKSGLYQEYLLFNSTNKPRDIWVWFSTMGAPSPIEKPGRYLSLVLVIVGILGHYRQGKVRALSIVGIALLSTTLALIAYEVLKYSYQSRRLLFLLPIYLLYEAKGAVVLGEWFAQALRPRPKGARAPLVLLLPALPLVLFAALSLARVHFLKFRENGGYRDGDWRAIAATIRAAQLPTQPIAVFDEQPLPNYRQFHYYRDLLIPGVALTLLTTSSLSREGDEPRVRAWGIVPDRAAPSFNEAATSATLHKRFFGARLYDVYIPPGTLGSAAGGTTPAAPYSDFA